MPRAPRIEFEGAQYHVMCRGDRREPIFRGEKDHELFLTTLRQACQRAGWFVHAFVLMKNHYHLLLETPAGNLVGGMRWFQTTYTARFNARHRLSGHLFQGRYKALVVDPDEPEYARQVADYVHLNPVRAGAITEEAELAKLSWCSYAAYVSAKKPPPWLRRKAVYGELSLKPERAADRRRFRRYMNDLISVERTRAHEPDRGDEPANAVRTGWLIGGERFRERMEDLVGTVVRKSRRDSFTGAAVRKYDEVAAMELIERGLQALGIDLEAMRAMKKNDIRKQALGWLVKRRTIVSNEWICDRIEMGHWSNLSRAFRAMERAQRGEAKRLKGKMLKCTD